MATRSKAKAENRRQNRDARPFAVAKYIRIAPSKVHVVLDVIRGKGYNEAVAILMNTPKAASEPVLKVLNSAAETTCSSPSATPIRDPRSREFSPFPRAGLTAF